MPHPLTERERTTRQISILALFVAALLWGPALMPQGQIIAVALQGYLPFPPRGSHEFFAGWWIPTGILCALAALGWIYRSKELAILALLMPFAGIALFILRIGPTLRGIH